MKILVVGGGGREHALTWKLAQSPRVTELYCAPGNPGIARQAKCLPVSAENVPGLVTLAKDLAIDLVVVGPEAPLTMGLADLLTEAGIKVFGPSASAARIEGSKVWAKDLMKKYSLPTATYEVFSDYQAALDYVRRQSTPLVVKADGLAAGKGVLICQNMAEAEEAVNRVMKTKAFGSAGDRVVIEEFLTGEEASFLVFTDGRTLKALPSSQDHKAVFNNDLGPNTGGMGAYSPAPVVTPAVEATIMDRIMLPAVQALTQEGCPYRGVLYAGLMISPDGPKLLEFNARFGDPECQPLLMRLKSDLAEILEAVADGRLDQVEPVWDQRATVCVVMASGGYPGDYAKGHEIFGLDKAAAQLEVVIFHAGTTEKHGRIVTNGGRVLGVTAIGDNVSQAIRRAYQATELISWTDLHYRTDIGHRAINR